MSAFYVLVCAAVTLLAAVAESSSSGGPGNFNYDLSGADLRRVLNSPVQKAEWMIRPLGSSSTIVGPLSHTGVRVTLQDGSQWLIHKGGNYGINSDTVVTAARHMSSRWQKTQWEREFNGSKKVTDFVKTGGATYNLLFNCHVASIRMLLQ